MSALRRLLGAELFQEWNSLARESDPTMLGEGLLSLALRLENRGGFAAAAELYAWMASSSLPDAVSRRARARLQTLRGQGALAPLVESMVRRFADQALSPTMIAAFGVGSWVAGISRLSVASSLATRAPSFLTRGLALRGLSGLAAYSAEVPAFVAARRGFSLLAGNAEESGPGWGEELRSAALFMGVMHGMGLLGSAAGRPLRAHPAAETLAQSTFGIGGVYLAHRLEEGLGLRSARSEAQRWVETGDTWLQMRVGARLMQGLAGAPNHGVMAERILEYGAAQGFGSRPTSPARIFDELFDARSPVLPTGFLNRSSSVHARNF
ncbi:MAG: hypothetical protein K8R69_03275, partial [Deltaproteobacteria bacterium]|nr:hypothetical protein [Deltaproteobacteria bacterium]